MNQVFSPNPIRVHLEGKMRLPLMLFILLSSSCEDPIELDIPDGPPRVVVEGWITNESRPYEIRLSQTNNFNEIRANPSISSANVEVITSNGSVYDFMESEPGIYLSDGSWTGEVGVLYGCQIQLPNGTRLESSFEQLNTVPQIDTLFYKPFEPPTIVEGVILQEYFLTASISDPPLSENFYRWQYVVNDVFLTAPEQIFLFSDRFVDGNAFQVENPQVLLTVGDRVMIVQQSLSKQAFDYFELLISQATTLGQSSGTAPAVLRGNIRNVADPDNIILGYFGVSAVARSEIVISSEN